MSREIICDCGNEEDKKRAIIVKILDNYIGITRLANVIILPAPGPLISKLLIGHKCKIRVRTSARSACESTVGVLCGQLVNRINYTSTDCE